jgi:hypothetical protein
MDRKDFIEIMNLIANRGASMVHYVQIEYKNGNLLSSTNKCNFKKKTKEKSF